MPVVGPIGRMGSLGQGEEVHHVLAGVPSPGDKLWRDTDCVIVELASISQLHQATAVAAAGLQGVPPSMNEK